MHKEIVDIRATDTHLQENIISLDTYITTVNSNNNNFNQYVELIVDSLNARSESIKNLMINLLKSYQFFLDTEFVRYIKAKKYQYDNGEEASAYQLMPSIKY